MFMCKADYAWTCIWEQTVMFEKRKKITTWTVKMTQNVSLLIDSIQILLVKVVTLLIERLKTKGTEATGRATSEETGNQMHIKLQPQFGSYPPQVTICFSNVTCLWRFSHSLLKLTVNRFISAPRTRYFLNKWSLVHVHTCENSAAVMPETGAES